MGDYYKVLGLEQGASQMEIKKAYFSLVRKYSPEESPEKFREIREAYERLKNQAEIQGPVFARPSEPLAEKFLSLYRQYEEAHDDQAARNVCEEAWKRFPEEIQFLYYLAVAQRRAGNTGKSVKSCEELIKREPDNKWLWREAALSYDERSYSRKAYQAYEKAYELGCRDNRFLIDFSLSCDNYEQYDRGIEVLKEVVKKDRRWRREEIPEVLDAYSGLLTLYDAAERNPVDILTSLNQFIQQYSIYMPDHFELLAMIILRLSMAQEGDIYEIVQEILASVEKICSNAEGKQWLSQLVKHSRESRIMEDKRISETMWMGVQAYFLMDDMDAEVRSFATLDFKLCAIQERQEMLQQLELLEKEYPEHYEKMREFAEQLKSGKNLGYVKSSLMKQYVRLIQYVGGGMYFEKYPDEKKKAMGTVFYQSEDDRPFVRGSKKIGRNDPCPCGSGKKYKHCCMKKDNAAMA